MCIDSFTKCEIRESIQRIEELLNSGIFLQKNSRSPFVRSAFIDMLVCLRDLMYKSEKYSSRIIFDDGIVKTKGINDVSDTITYVRDALCHLDSDNHYLEDGNVRASYNVIYSKGCLMNIGNSKQASNYKDDVCFFFGQQKIYLKRHIIRALDEAKKNLSPLLS
jgi:hypothetical protein